MLPRFDTIAAVAGQGEVPVVSRPRNYIGQQATQYGYYGQPSPPQHAGGQVFQVPMAAYRSNAHPSIEASTPPAAFSSPRVMNNDYAYDTSSVSSSSRESSAHPRGSVSSTTAQSRSTRAKRGSESQASGSDRSTKRPSTRARSNGGNDELWCVECHCCPKECTDPETHSFKLKKIVKEKSSRSAQAAILQNCEDLTQIALNVNVDKIQQPGNKKKSGLTVDKKQGLMITEIALDEGLQTIAGLGHEQFNAFKQRVHLRTQERLTSECPSELPKGSLMAGRNGEEPCGHTQCADPIECRKTRRSAPCNHNLNQLMASPMHAASRHSSADSRSKSSTPRRH